MHYRGALWLCPFFINKYVIQLFWMVVLGAGAFSWCFEAELIRDVILFGGGAGCTVAELTRDLILLGGCAGCWCILVVLCG